MSQHPWRSIGTGEQLEGRHVSQNLTQPRGRREAVILRPSGVASVKRGEALGLQALSDGTSGRARLARASQTALPDDELP